MHYFSNPPPLLFDFRRMSSDDGIVVLRLLEQVNRILEVCTPKSVSAQETAMLFGGLRHLHPSHVEVRHILAHVLRLASLCNERLSDRGIMMVSMGVKVLIGKEEPSAKAVLNLARDLIEFSENSTSNQEFVSKMEKTRKRVIHLVSPSSSPTTEMNKVN